MTRQLAYLLFTLLIIAACGRNPPAPDQIPPTNVEPTPPTESPLTFTETDKTKIIRQTLAQIAYLPDDNFLSQDGSSIVLSTANLPLTLIPELAEGNLALLSPSEIQNRANAKGDFLYLLLEKVEAESPRKAESVLCSVWAIAANSEMEYLSGGCIIMEFRKEGGDGKWMGEIVATLVS